MSNETWLIGRKVDASKKIFWATEILVFDFELFIGGRSQKDKGLILSSCQPFAQFMTYTKCE